MNNLSVAPIQGKILIIASLALSLCLSACGGGGSSDGSVSGQAAAQNLPGGAAATPNTPPANEPPAVLSPPAGEPPVATVPPVATTPPASTPPAPTPPATPLATLPPVAQIANAITVVRLQNDANAKTNAPITFGQVFAVGDFPSTQTLVGKLANNSSIPLQVDVKATHSDGSIRHAVISAIVPSLTANQILDLGLVKTAAVTSGATITPTALLNAGFNAQVAITLGGQTYTATAESGLSSATYSTWLKGGVVNEWQVVAPLKANGTAHPHLVARFAIRHYVGTNQARVDVTVENGWAYEPNPQNFTYDVVVNVGGKQVYSKTALTHFQHARWRKVFWWGADPAVHVRHQTSYLIASKALPNFDQSLTFTESTLAAMQTGWTGAKTEPMGSGQAYAAMPTTGGRPDIGLLPGWATTYLLTMDKRAKDVTLGTADLAGSWGSHFRDKNTDRPVSVVDYPYMTILGHASDTLNPVTHKFEAFPDCPTGADCNNANAHDASHQPAFAYLPYLVTGDYYYLEELQFWAMWNSFASNPGYRDNAKGLYKSDQVRGQAWSMRTIGEAAYITPDNDSLKSHLSSVLDANLDWYNTAYTSNVSANKLGAIVNGYAIDYNNGTGIAPWMDDFFTSAVGHIAELGYSKAQGLLAWKVQFPISRMVGSGACWIDGAIYALTIRDSSTSPLYDTIGQAYRASHTPAINALACGSQAMATALGLQVGSMTGYADVVTGFPSNMQPALAYGADVGGANGTAAWQQFSARTVKPDYSLGPQFDIVPRK